MSLINNRTIKKVVRSSLGHFVRIDGLRVLFDLPRRIGRPEKPSSFALRQPTGAQFRLVAAILPPAQNRPSRNQFSGSHG